MRTRSNGIHWPPNPTAGTAESWNERAPAPAIAFASTATPSYPILPRATTPTMSTDRARSSIPPHPRGIMVILDVVYNHFGPEGNYLHLYAPQFFTERHRTPWGAAINFEGERVVRDFFVHNALYWLEEFSVDGLRFDAVHAIVDDSRLDILTELAERGHAGPGRQRMIHLV